MLSVSDVLPYLCRRQLLGTAAVVRGDVKVFDVSRRNRNFKVIRSDGTSLFVKQGQTRDGYSTIRREATVYALLQEAAAQGHRCDFAPEFVAYDERQDALIIEFLPHTVDLRQYDAARKATPLRAAARVGAVLATLHTLVPARTALARVGEGEPGVLAAQRPGLALLRDFSGASIDLVRMVQGDADVVAHLEELQHDWKLEALIHHDVRWDNILVGRGGARVTLIDWETAAVGDCAWDIGSAIGDYLTQWLLSIPSTGNTPPDQALQHARRPLNTLQPAISALWDSYCKYGQLAPSEVDELKTRTTRFVGLKLIQSAIEQVQRSPRWTVGAICQLQVAANMMSRPEQAARVLLGLRVDA